MTEVEIYQPRADLAVNGAVTPQMDSWIAVCSDVIKVANVICDTPFVPDGLRGSGPAVAAAILAGRELSLGPMTSLANIHVIKGKPALSAVLMRALVQAQGHQWQDGDVSDTRAVVRGRRKGEAEWTEVIFTAAQAKQAGIDLGKYPQDKLYARATSRLARRKFADVIAGMPYSAEELEDGPGDVMLADDPGYAADRAAAKADGNGQAPAPKTAQRATRRRQQAAAGSPVTAPPPAAPAAQDAALPPLPGEDEEPAGTVPAAAARGMGTPAEPGERDYDSPGTVTRAQLTAIWTVLTGVFKFTSDEKDEARAVCAHVIGHELASTKDMAKNEAKAVLDTLGNWRELAEGNQVTPREFLIELMAMAQEANGDG